MTGFVFKRELSKAFKDTTTFKLASKNTNGLRNNLNRPEELNIYYQGSQDGEKHTKPGTHQLKSFLSSRIESTYDSKLNNITHYLDNDLQEAKNNIIYIRSVLEKLCRELRSNSSPLPEVDNPENTTSTNQPNKLSIP
ncbi:uncharacterized protein LOC122402651 [Colletes gigas]|uniref:uncharacterized protein LOC122402651 n=1 Tax=Colletes gigas TaxID=935657 RepID=UPI001C9B84B1|nr:uncharacterized protein LOC122402651 [Colletes gigas]